MIHTPEDVYASREDSSPVPPKRLREDQEMSSERERRSRERRSPFIQEQQSNEDYDRDWRRDDYDRDRRRYDYDQDRRRDDYDDKHRDDYDYRDDYDQDRRRDDYDRDRRRGDYDRDERRDEYDSNRYRDDYEREREGSRERSYRRSSLERESHERRVVRVEEDRRTVRVENSCRRSSGGSPAPPGEEPRQWPQQASAPNVSMPGWNNPPPGSMPPNNVFPMMNMPPVPVPTMGSPSGFVQYPGLPVVPPAALGALGALGALLPRGGFPPFPQMPLMAANPGHPGTPGMLPGAPVRPGLPGWNPNNPPADMPKVAAVNKAMPNNQPPRRRSLREISTTNEPMPPGVDFDAPVKKTEPSISSSYTQDTNNVLSVMTPLSEEPPKQETCRIPGLDFINDDDTGNQAQSSQNFWQLPTVAKIGENSNQTDNIVPKPEGSQPEQAKGKVNAEKPAVQPPAVNVVGTSEKSEVKKKVKTEPEEVKFVRGMQCPVPACKKNFYHELSPFVLHWIVSHEMLMDTYACHACMHANNVPQWEGSLMHHLAHKHGISGDESLVKTYKYGVVKKKISTHYIDPEGYKFDVSRGLQEVASSVLAKGKSLENNTSYLRTGRLESASTPVLFRKNMTCPVPGCSSSAPFTILDDFIEHWNSVHQPDCPYFVCLLCRADTTGTRQTAVKKLSAMHKHFTKEHPAHRFMLVTVPPGKNPNIPEVCYEMHANASFIEPSGYKFILGDKSECHCWGTLPL